MGPSSRDRGSLGGPTDGAKGSSVPERGSREAMDQDIIIGAGKLEGRPGGGNREGTWDQVDDQGGLGRWTSTKFKTSWMCSTNRRARPRRGTYQGTRFSPSTKFKTSFLCCVQQNGGRI